MRYAKRALLLVLLCALYSQAAAGAEEIDVLKPEQAPVKTADSVREQGGAEKDGIRKQDGANGEIGEDVVGSEADSAAERDVSEKEKSAEASGLESGSEPENSGENGENGEGTADATGSMAEGGAETAEPEATDAGALLAAYVSAAFKAGIWNDFAAAAERLYRNREVLARFGLAAPDELGPMREELAAALKQRDMWRSAQEEAYASLAEYVTLRAAHPGPHAAKAAESAEESEAENGGEASDPAAIEAMFAAELQAEKVCRDVRSAELQFKAGLLPIDLLLQSHRSCLEARLAAQEAREAWYYALLAGGAADKEPSLPQIALLQRLSDAHPALAAEWFRMLAAPGEGEAPPGSFVAIPGTSLVVVPQTDDGGKVRVPLRPFAEALGLDIKWNEETGQVALSGERIRIVLTVGERRAAADDRIAELSEAPVIAEGNTHVPLDFFTAAMGFAVYWNESAGLGLVIP